MLNIPQTGVVTLGVWLTHKRLTYRLNDGVLEYCTASSPGCWNVGTGPGPQASWARFEGFTEWVEKRLIELGAMKPPVPPAELIAKYKAAIEAALGSLGDRQQATKILEEALS